MKSRKFGHNRKDGPIQVFYDEQTGRIAMGDYWFTESGVTYDCGGQLYGLSGTRLLRKDVKAWLDRQATRYRDNLVIEEECNV